MPRPIINFALIFALISLAFIISRPKAASAQNPSGQQPKGTATAPKPTPTPKPIPQQKIDPNNLTAEQIVETTIAVYGSRPGLALVRRNGWERGRMTSILDDGRTEDGTYERRFIRGESVDKDKIRLDQKTPNLEYSLVYGEGKTWGLLNGSMFTPRSEATTNFLSQLWHGLDALLRYKENGSTITLVGKDKQQNIDLYVIDLVDKQQRKTRYYISQKFFRVHWLEYEEPTADGGKPVKYVRKFSDYQYIQSTLVPKRTILFE
ncbi:MAG TPA: hypothetical protein VKB86_07025, partial [Pyrinomonadaceae bacterium]|nr:hypothetical protein [Pyrinomonadaceae bacterium]